MDDTDNHETETALRETEEEIGLRSEFIDVRLHASLSLSTVGKLISNVL